MVFICIVPNWARATFYSVPSSLHAYNIPASLSFSGHRRPILAAKGWTLPHSPLPFSGGFALTLSPLFAAHRRPTLTTKVVTISFHPSLFFRSPKTHPRIQSWVKGYTAIPMADASHIAFDTTFESTLDGWRVNPLRVKGLRASLNLLILTLNLAASGDVGGAEGGLTLQLSVFQVTENPSSHNAAPSIAPDWARALSYSVKLTLHALPHSCTSLFFRSPKTSG